MAKSAVDALLESAADIPAAAPATEFKPPLPKTKGEVGKLSTDQMDALIEAHGLGMPGEWGEGSAAEKHKMLNVALGFAASKKKKGEAVVLVAAETTYSEVPATDDPPFDVDDKSEAEVLAQPNAANLALLEGADDDNNPIMQVANEIEGLKDQASIETEITTVLASEGMNDFRLGGLLLKLLEVGTFNDNSTFKEYIEQRWGVKYRKARYLIELYNGLLKSGIPWEAVAGIGWSKVITLLPVLTKENVASWVEKAKQYNNDTLQGAVKAALAGDGATNPKDADLQASKLKTLTFGVGPDQEELIGEAVKHAMAVGKTEHKGVALELICTEYLGNTTSKTSAPKKADKPQLVPGTMTLEQHHTQLTNALAVAYEPKAIFKHFLEQANGDVANAMGMLFGGDAFDAVFPNVTLSIDVKS